MTLDEQVATDFAQPKERRKKVDVYLFPSMKAEVDACRGKLERSLWIERAIAAYLSQMAAKSA